MSGHSATVAVSTTTRVSRTGASLLLLFGLYRLSTSIDVVGTARDVAASAYRHVRKAIPRLGPDRHIRQFLASLRVQPTPADDEPIATVRIRKITRQMRERFAGLGPARQREILLETVVIRSLLARSFPHALYLEPAVDWLRADDLPTVSTGFFVLTQLVNDLDDAVLERATDIALGLLLADGQKRSLALSFVSSVLRVREPLPDALAARLVAGLTDTLQRNPGAGIVLASLPDGSVPLQVRAVLEACAEEALEAVAQSRFQSIRRLYASVPVLRQMVRRPDAPLDRIGPLLVKAILALRQQCPQRYRFYRLPSPWLMCALLDLLGACGDALSPEDRALVETDITNIILRPVMSQGRRVTEFFTATAAIQLSTVEMALRVHDTTADPLAEHLVRFLDIASPNCRHAALNRLLCILRTDADQGPDSTMLGDGTRRKILDALVVLATKDVQLTLPVFEALVGLLDRASPDDALAMLTKLRPARAHFPDGALALLSRIAFDLESPWLFQS